MSEAEGNGRHVATRYRPGAKVGRRTIGTAGAWAALSALAAGLLAHMVSRVLFPIDLVLPAAVGALVGGSIAWSVRRVQLSRPGPAVALAAAAVVLAMLLQLLLDFHVARSARAHELDEVFSVRESSGLATREELAQERDEWMADWTFWHYARARFGADDSGSFTGTPPVLGRAGAMALSGLELLVAIVIAGLWAGRVAGEPACPLCGAWRVERPLGGAAHGVAAATVERMLAGDMAGAVRLLRPPDTREEVTFSLFTCPAGHDPEGGVLRVGEVVWTRRRSLAVRRIADLVVSGDAVTAIAGGLETGREPGTGT